VWNEVLNLKITEKDKHENCSRGFSILYSSNSLRIFLIALKADIFNIFPIQYYLHLHEKDHTCTDKIKDENIYLAVPSWHN